MLNDYAASDGQELWNLTRLQAYLTNVGSPFDTGPGVCGCDTLTPELVGGTGTAYVDPETDEAPWYDPDVPQSAEFLGFLPTAVSGTEDNPRSRNVTNAVGGGGVFGPVRALPRTITVTGTLIGTSCCGVDYGLHYLTEALQSCTGADCDGSCLTMFDCCPAPGLTPAQFNAAHRRTFRRAALVSGPTVTNRSSTNVPCSGNGCRGGDLVDIEFVIVAATPWAWTDPEPKLDVSLPVVDDECVEWCLDSVDGVCEGEPCLFADCVDDTSCQDPLDTFAVPPQPSIPTTTFCVPLVPNRACYSVDLSDRPRWSEDYPIVSVSAGDADLRNVRVVMYENLDPSQPCDDQADMSLCRPVNDFYITYIPAGSSVTIDGQVNKAMLYCNNDCSPATTVYGDADGGPLSIEPLTCAGCCVCIEVDGNFPPAADARVTLDVSGRGL